MTFSEIVANLASDLIYLARLDKAHACPRQVKYPDTMIQILTVGGGKKHFICLETTPQESVKSTKIKSAMACHIEKSVSGYPSTSGFI